MGSVGGAAGSRTPESEVELAPLTDAGGEVQMLVDEQKHAGADADAAEPWPWFVIPVLVLAVRRHSGPACTAPSAAGAAFLGRSTAF